MNHENSVVLTEKVLKDFLVKKPTSKLLVKWDSPSKHFIMCLVFPDGTNKTIKTWLGDDKVFRNLALAINWAEKIGFNKIIFEEIDLSIDEAR